MATVLLGTRVVVRHLIEDGERATDALGELVDRDVTDNPATSWVEVETRRGRVRIPLAHIVVAKVVPPAPPRRRA